MTPQLPGDETDDPKIGPAVNPPLPKLSPSSSSEQQNLRCPRCESTNTKFCYYNNYNLTQPRHFCKSCRRYWTQGGALRNVPVGGGCRKAKANGVTCGGVKSFGGAANKAKPLSRITLGVGSSSQFDYGFHSSPPSWTEPLNSNLRSLLRAATPSPVLNAGPNYTTDINPLRIKEEGPSMAADASLLINALNPRSFCMEPLETQQNQNSDLFFCETTAPGIHGLRQRQRSPAINWEDHSGMASGNVDYLSSHSDFLLSFPSETGATATRGSLEPNPVAGGEWGLCNAPFIWADTPNAAFP